MLRLVEYMRIVGAVEAVGKGARTCRLSCGLLSIGELSGMDRLYRTRKRWGMEKGDAGPQRLSQKKRPD